MTLIATKIAEVIDLAIHSQDGISHFRGDILGEEWKIIIEYDGNTDTFTTVIKRRG